ncbi:MAG: hypothetical protein ACO3A2_10455 [Bdellovibrionia bacterium]
MLRNVWNRGLRESFFVLFVFLLGLSRSSVAGEGHVGEIRYSILTPDQFQEKYGSEWELMRGQAIPLQSELLNLWGKPEVPDSRGLFLRCTHQGRIDGLGNPLGDQVQCGDYMADDGISRLACHETAASSGTETRLSSISVNTFIKMRESPQIKSNSFLITEERMRQITGRPEFEAAVQKVVRQMILQNRSP